MVEALTVVAQRHMWPVPLSHTFAIRAEANAESLPHLLSVFAHRGLVPVQLCSRRTDRYLLVDVQIEGANEIASDSLLQELRTIALVDRAAIVIGRC